MIEISEAIKIIEREIDLLGSESIDLSDAIRRVLAENIIADTDLPPFDRSQMDGFAVLAADTKKAPVTLKIAGESAAGRGWHHTMKSGDAVRIMTGAPVPAGADAVQKVELTKDLGDIVEIREPVQKGMAIVKKGAEIKKGSVVLTLGEVVTENMVAAIASFGYAKVKVLKRPRIAILATGSEIVDVSKKPGRDQIRNSNSVMLKVLAERAEAIVETFPIASDELSNLKSQIKIAIKSADILIITGGVSVGKYDLTKLALTELGGKIFFDKIKLKPGKPAVFSKINKTLVFGLPGNPVSAAVTFYLFVRMAILQMQSAAASHLKEGLAVLGKDAKAPRDRDTYLPSKLSTNKSGSLIATPLRSQGSSDFVGFARAEALIIVPSGKLLTKGETVRFLFL